ncbi:hypothetical protein H696_04435 [Fonticula alba]|uniref:Pre-mRNA-splicing factor CDC5/CEF1 n=1 Tax=Fonticula alba TaxID=691883 RepID=A0A058Z450_FONAL|nr:hypothetical protein H696_04435 [Fonticula alba]KCV69015.1 hypothetical protein H696_04435 [Fonticula alba]|eukprot:XP_009496586.1 hypothetical protein H696_04435 [Fonticula alba]
MTRIITKGGVWRNTEDEILKAAVMKYGLSQWARISSLLSRKTPKQCKARWENWLDPNIKKTEWSTEEEERLVHLATLMPCQWNTIAKQLNGRTADQCLEHYKSLQLAAVKEQDSDAVEEVSRYKIDDRDRNPESKPARPDPVDMEEEEKEMIAEARARLANTQGKKAKRKAREKQLEEARRLATLQKQRELKAAGISVYAKRLRHDEMDYNQDIPFYQPAPAGFFDTTKELGRPKKEFQKRSLKDLEGPRRDERNEAARKAQEQKAKDAKKDKKALPKLVAELDDEAQFTKRPRLNLPAPQADQADIDQVVKMSQRLRDLPGAGADDAPLGGAGGTALDALRTPAQMLQTPAQLLQTPRNAGAGGSAFGVSAAAAAGGLSALFKSLPRPQNEIELELPNEEEPALDEDGFALPGRRSGGPAPMEVEDAEDIRLREERRRQAEEERRLLERSQVVQRGLPRPGQLHAQLFRHADSSTVAALIDQELLSMLEHDAAVHPPAGTPAGRAPAGFVHVSLEEMASAKELIEAELGASLGGLSVSTDSGATVTLPVAKADFEPAHEHVLVSMLLSGSKGHQMSDDLSRSERVTALRANYDQIRQAMIREDKRARRIESRLAIVLGGYIKRADALSKEAIEVGTRLDTTLQDEVAFRHLAEVEASGAESRSKQLESACHSIAEDEARAQRHFAELSAEYDQLRLQIADVKSKLISGGVI